jgi:hypothetical protein
MRRARSWVMTSAVLTLLTATAPSGAASVTLDLDLEPQYASQLCWAAVNTMALSSFFPASICQVNASPGQSSQAKDAAYGILHVTALSAPLPPLTSPPTPPPGLQQLLATTSGTTSVNHVLDDCTTNIQACNRPGVPILLGLSYKTTQTTGTQPNPGLSWVQATQQIDAGHPFLFVWKFPSGGLHQLIAIGYSDDLAQQKLKIWDPLPVPKTSEVIAMAPLCGPLTSLTPKQIGSLHMKPIDFSTYTDPTNDMGVAAVHDDDQYDLALLSVPQSPDLHVSRNMSPIPRSDRRSNTIMGMSFTKVLFSSQPAPAKPEMSTKADPQKNSAVAGPRELGIPFPIVGLGVDQLSKPGADPTKLLTQSILTVLFPVEVKGAVVDSFLMLFRNGRWERGGYSNTEVTRLMVETRLQYAAEHDLNPKDFYMVSVPGLAAFFVAHGYGSQAVLIPASNDPLIGAVAGSATPAAIQFGRLIDTINRLAAATLNKRMTVPSGHPSSDQSLQKVH